MDPRIFQLCRRCVRRDFEVRRTQATHKKRQNAYGKENEDVTRLLKVIVLRVKIHLTLNKKVGSLQCRPQTQAPKDKPFFVH